ncbi:MAG: hypothetical protein EON60_07925 [Alphaproteobacteria bacterium]|nr:MAG: hypothetical protein EON60_07925 [Alphaproteobacteria bacterium]
MLQALNNAIVKWQVMMKDDAIVTADMVVTTEYSPTDQLRDTLVNEAPLSEPFSPQVRKAFAEWLAMPVTQGFRYADDREPAHNLFTVALPFFAEDMAAEVEAHNQLNRQKFS